MAGGWRKSELEDATSFAASLKRDFKQSRWTFSPWHMADAREEAAKAGEPDFACVSAPMACLPFADGSIDIVYFHAAIHHALPRDHAAFKWSDANNLVDCLREVRRILKPRTEGGAFFLLGEGIYPECLSGDNLIDMKSFVIHWALPDSMEVVSVDERKSCAL